jgi:putative NADH-flavin reductase
MRLFVVGANGRTGTQLIELALARGHEVTAFVRSPEKIRIRNTRLEVQRGDPHRVDELASVLPEHELTVAKVLGILALVLPGVPFKARGYRD